MNYTTIEQSKKLVELGLNLDTADMFWQSNLNSSDRQYLLDLGEEEYFDIELNFEHYSIGDYDIPAWSLGALLKLMPTQIEEVKGHKVDLILGHPKNKWCLAYFDWTGLQQGHDTTGDSPFEAVYNMVVWLLENGYIKKGE